MTTAVVPTCHKSPVPIRLATAADLDWLLVMQRMESNRLGFLPSTAVAQYVKIGGVRIALVDGHPAGYVLGRPSLRCARWCRPITQVVVLPTCRRKGIGRALLTAVAADATADGRSALQAWTRADLPANWWFAHLGWTPIGTREVKSVRGHPLICRRLSLLPEPHAEFNVMPRNAGYRGKRVERTAVHEQLLMF